jgi:rhomboid protease GluP
MGFLDKLKPRKHGTTLCPSCGRLVSINADRCMHCGRWRPGLWGWGPVLQNLLGDVGVISLVTALMIGLYVLSLLLDPRAIFRSGGFLNFLSPSMQSLYKLGMTGTLAMSQGRWWTLFTAIYLHGGILHILFNVLWIRQIGPVVENVYGASRFVVIFTFAGVFGFLVSNFLGVPFTIGASGSIFGLFGALVYYGRTRGGTFGTAVYRQVGQWALVLFLFGFMFPGINNWAHAGGFVGGYLAGRLLGFLESKRESSVDHFLGLGAAALTILSFVMTLWVGFL